MYDVPDMIKAIPPMLSGEELKYKLQILPDYDPVIRNENDAIRLMNLSSLYNIYIPSKMSTEIYSKLYLALLRSLQKKGTRLAVIQQNENHKAICQMEYSGIIGGSDSFTIIGTSGIGKSTTISRALTAIKAGRVIEINEPMQKIIPCVVVQCPFDSSVRAMLLEILRKVDEVLETKYYANALRARATTDMLIGSVSQVALNHIGLLVVDEIQNVVNSKNGKSLIGSLTQLINNTGISICMVGTPESTVFFEQAVQLARRSIGLQYHCMEYDADFRSFCESVFSYQYVRTYTELTDGITEWLYEHSAGVAAIVITLIHDAQEIAIANGSETLDLDTLNFAYKQRLAFLHSYIKPSITSGKQSGTVRKKKIRLPEQCESEAERLISIDELVNKAKADNLDIVDVLREVIDVTEVAV